MVMTVFIAIDDEEVGQQEQKGVAVLPQVFAGSTDPPEALLHGAGEGGQKWTWRTSRSRGIVNSSHQRTTTRKPVRAARGGG